MLDFSLSEMALIALVGILVIKPEDLPAVIRAVKGIKQKIHNLKQEVSDSIADIDALKTLKEDYDAIEKEFKTITDLNGNPQRIYDIEAIKRDLSHMASPPDTPPGKDSHKSPDG